MKLHTYVLSAVILFSLGCNPNNNRNTKQALDERSLIPKKDWEELSTKIGKASELEESIKIMEEFLKYYDNADAVYGLMSLCCDEAQIACKLSSFEIASELSSRYGTAEDACIDRLCELGKKGDEKAIKKLIRVYSDKRFNKNAGTLHSVTEALLTIGDPVIPLLEEAKKNGYLHASTCSDIMQAIKEKRLF